MNTEKLNNFYKKIYVIPYLDIRCLWSGLELKQGSETGKYPSASVNIRDKFGNYKNEN